MKFMHENHLQDTNTVPGPSHVKIREQMHGARYGEVLLVMGHLAYVEAKVYNTMGFSDCPEELWKELNGEEIKKEYKVRAVILNGPRYFLMDKVTIANVGEEFLTFGSLKMQRLATVKIPLGNLLGGLKRKPYTEHIIERTTTYVYNSGREVYELVASDGTVYIMQSYALIVDSTLTEEGLKTLGARLHLPPGWHYRVGQLAQERVLHVNGQVHLIQDDFENSYQRID